MIRIDQHSIGDKHKPFIIAEMSGNHNQSLERAWRLWKLRQKPGTWLKAANLYCRYHDLGQLQKVIFLSKIRIACGKENPYMNFIRKPIPRGNGTNRFSSVPVS
ncbi:hypothetical protein GKODMF_13280 [Candidatus Electrothrix gigas]